MDFSDLVRARHSIRAFTHEPVEPGKLNSILEAATRAPSAGNLQAYEICVVTRRTMLTALVQAALDQEFIAQAPVALVFCAHPARSSKRYGPRGVSLYCIQDATIACAYAQLAATALGLASVWVGAFHEDAVRAAIGVDNAWLPVAVLPIGYAGEPPKETSRRSLGNLVHYLR